MNHKFRIEENELLDANHYPVKVLFDMVTDNRFKEVILGLSNKRGFGENYGACNFWNNLDEYDKINTEKYEGIEFGLNNGDEIIITYEELFYYLKIICKKYCDAYPNEQRDIIKILKLYEMNIIN